MDSIITRYYPEWSHPSGVENGYNDYMTSSYSYGRLDQCVDCLVPWLKASVPELAGMRVLEVGSGTGSSTAGLAPFVKSIFGFDIEERALEVARHRCAALRLSNVLLRQYDVSWIDAFAADPQFFGQSFDLVFCYALFEHLTPVERVKLLRAIWNHLPVGGLLVTVELPNRLHWFDWHSSMMPFADMLPPDLSALYYGRSARHSIWSTIMASDIAQLDAMDLSQVYRFGKGMSFHEFQVALPDGSYEVIADFESPNAIGRTLLPGHDERWQNLLAEKLASMDPPVHRGFAASCLDLVIRKTA
jgi:S-adenosylmethionine-dependent methyltransferase